MMYSQCVIDLFAEVLSSEASLEDLINFNEIAFLRGNAAYRRYVDSIFQVSVSANRHLYDRMMKEDKENVRSLK